MCLVFWIVTFCSNICSMFQSCFEDVSVTNLQVIGSRSLQMNPVVPMLQCAVRQSIVIWPGSGLKSLLASMDEAVLFAGCNPNQLHPRLG